MTPEQRQQIIDLLQSGNEISPDWARVLFPPEKREYELVYYGKEREEDIISNTLSVPLQPMRAFNQNGGDWSNKVIFGDNLQVMKNLLEQKRAGKLLNSDGSSGVKLVYIDPPFATKKDFAGEDEERAYGDKVHGAEFLEFIRRRLILIRELLTPDGAVYVHLDQKKVHYIKILMDEIFGEGRLRNELVWHYKFRLMRSERKFNKKHDTILFYSRGKDHKIDMPTEEWTREGIIQARKQEIHVDEDGREWIWMPGGKGNSKNKIKYIEDIIAEGKAIDDVWDIPVISSSSSERTGYPTQKPEQLLDLIVRASSKPGDIVLDAFAGSGTSLAVAEKLSRRWIGIDCGKLAIYSIQKRMLNLRAEIGDDGPALKASPFTLYNAGLYDFSKLRELPWDSWRFFALQLFQCRDEAHRIGGIQFDGYLRGASVLVFNHLKQKGVRVTEETIYSIHEAVGSRVGARVFIVAPALSFDFQQDYIDVDGVRYYALRIPYSIINELHQREFLALKQPSDELAVNDTVEAVGFDFIRTPEVDYELGVKSEGKLFPDAYIRLVTFKSDAAVREPLRKRGNLETLSMIMVDYNYGGDSNDSDVFNLTGVFYAGELSKTNWELRLPANLLGERVMVIFVDIYGNEARELIAREQFGLATVPAATKASNSPKRSKQAAK